MHRSVDTTRLDPSIRSLLSALRRRIRVYIWAEALATIVLWVAIAFWVSLALDWTFEPAPHVRWILWCAVFCVLGLVLYRVLLRKCFARLSDSSMALLIERKYADLRDSLLTTVELAEATPRDEQFDLAMLDQVRDQAAELAQEVRLRKIFDFRPLVRMTTVATMLAASVVAFFFLAPDAYATWQDRIIGFAPDPWPRKTLITVEGFDSGVMKVARGDDVKIIALADITKVVPETVTLFYGSEDSGRRRTNMNRHGNAAIDSEAALSRTRYQRFSYQLKNVQREISLEIRGDDMRIRNLRIMPVPPPTLTDIVVYCEYPEYLVDEATESYLPREIPVTGTVALPRGTRVEIRAQANKPLADVRWKDQIDAESWQSFHSEWLNNDRFVVPYGKLEEDAILSFVLKDDDGIQNRRTIQINLRAAPDIAPQVAVKLEGIGSDVTPNAVLPFRGTISDEYGVTETSFEYQLDSNPAERMTIDSIKQAPTSIEVQHTQDLAALNLQPGQQIQVSMAAADTLWSHRKQRLKSLKQGDDDTTDTLLEALEANVGHSPPYSLRVVTPERLRSILATREWTLTRRFRNMVRDFEQMRESLARIQFATEDSADVESRQRIHARRLGTISAAIRASRSTRRGTLDIASDIERILIELENNQIPTKDLRPRLHDRVAVPLRRIAGKPLVRLTDLLEDAQAAASDPAKGILARDRAVEHSDILLVEMNIVLKAMKASEEFNELILRVKKMIENQAHLQEQTEEARKAAERKALELLDD